MMVTALVPMEVGAMKGKKGDKGKTGYGKGKYGKSFAKCDNSNEYRKNNECGKGSEKGKTKERKAKEKDKEKTKGQRQIRVSRATAGHVGSGGTRQVSVGKGTRKPWRKSEFFCEFSGAECSDHTCGCEDSSVHLRDQ